jgi:hypothetical protein
MPSSETERFDASDRERRLEEVIATYLRAVQAGQTPPREELLAQHPDLATDLNEFFSNQDQILQLAAPLRGLSAAANAQSAGRLPLGTVRYFGDYELLEEIARGGMGVVYRARQVSLNRPVALKMILAGQLASPADVQRFRTEAEAAANLDHPNIVPIFEVGEHEGQHYFSMKLIDGGSLAQKLADAKKPGGAEQPGVWANDQRAVARLLATVARAYTTPTSVASCTAISNRATSCCRFVVRRFIAVPGSATPMNWRTTNPS